jgi:hypothetical protein
VAIGTGNKILANDYNAIQSLVASILGTGYTGSANAGYGQTVASSQVTTRTKIVVTNDSIGYLTADMTKIAAHQGNSFTIPANILKGNRINAVDFSYLGSTAIGFYGSRFSITSGQYSTDTLSVGTRTTSWGSGSASIQHNVTITFSDANNARYFFNAGGSITFTASRSGGSTTTQNTDWTNLLSDIGTVTFNYNGTSSSTGHGTGSSIGWFNLTTTAQQIYTHAGNMETGGSKYGVNSYTINASTNSFATQLILSIVFLDAHTSTFSDFVDGTLTSTVADRRPTGTNVSLPLPTSSAATVAM